MRRSIDLVSTGSNFHNSAIGLINCVHCQLQEIVGMLDKPVVIEVSTQLGAKIDSFLSVVGIDTFSEYTSKVTDKAREGACLINHCSSNSTYLSTANLGVITDALENLVNSKAFALEIANFLRILCDSLSSNKRSAERKFWWVQRRIKSNGDVEISIVSVEALADTNMPGSQTIGTGTGSLELKIDVLQYGVPGELVRA
jgi:hypothetical protein